MRGNDYEHDVGSNAAKGENTRMPLHRSRQSIRKGSKSWYLNPNKIDPYSTL